MTAPADRTEASAPNGAAHPFAPDTDDDTPPPVDTDEDPFGAPRPSPEDRTRPLPHNLDAEASVLGGVILRNSLLPDLAFLDERDFYDPRHEAIYSATLALSAAGRVIDEVTIASQLQKMGKLDAVGGLAYLSQLGLRVPTADNAIHYAEIVRELAARREAALACSEMAARVRDRDIEPAELAAELARLADGLRSSGAEATGEAIVYGGNLLTFLGNEEPDDDPARDYIIHGLIPRGAPFVIGGHPKQGKTLIAEDLAIAVASGAPDWCGFPISEDMRGARVLLMPREDPRTETQVRLWRLARGRGIDPRSLAGKLEIDPVSPLWLDDPAHVEKLRRSARLFDLILIDSLQTVHRGDENSARDMAAICGAWRDVSLTGKATGLVHHYNGKGAEGDKRDPGHKLRGSSAIFATARHVVGIERMAKPDGAVAIRVSGNLSHLPAPFAVRRVEAKLATGRLTWRYESLGPLDSVRDPELADAIVKAIAAAMPKGLGTRDLREAVRGSGLEVENNAIDREARTLSREGRISRHTTRSPWRISEEESP